MTAKSSPKFHCRPVEVSCCSERRSGLWMWSILDNVYITHRILEYTQTIDLLCKSANLFHVPRSDRIKLQLNSKPADLLKIKRLLIFTRCLYGTLHVLSEAIVRIPYIELTLGYTKKDMLSQSSMCIHVSLHIHLSLNAGFFFSFIKTFFVKNLRSWTTVSWTTVSWTTVSCILSTVDKTNKANIIYIDVITYIHHIG